MSAPATPTPIGAAVWTRTLLHRQHLLNPVDDDAIEVIDRCVGLPCPDPDDALIGLAARIKDFDRTEVDDMLADGELTRVELFGGTPHLVDTEDARWIRALLTGDAADVAVTGDDARSDLIRMYLRGYGPASCAEIESWSGLTGLGRLLAAMESDWELCMYTSPGGTTLYDLDGLPLQTAGPFDETDTRRLLPASDHVCTLLVTRSGNVVPPARG